MITLIDLMQKRIEFDPDFGIIIKRGLDKIVIFDNGHTFNFTHYYGSNLTPLERYTNLRVGSDKGQQCLKFALQVASR